MSLITNTSLTPYSNWRGINLIDTTGTGITGYGSNQDPATLRQAASSGTSIKQNRILITAPDDTETTITLSAANAYTYAVSTTGYNIANTVLGYTTDEVLDGGIWEIEYMPAFLNTGVNIGTIIGSALVSYGSSYDLYFKGANYLIYPITGTLIYYKIVSQDLVNHTITLDGAFPSTGTIDAADYWVGYAKISYVPIASEIKECLDIKIADLAIDCDCQLDKVNKLLNMRLLYDGMFYACQQNNPTKAQQYFDLLSNFCDCECGC